MSAETQGPKGNFMGKLEAAERGAAKLMSFNGMMGYLGGKVADTVVDTAKDQAVKEFDEIKQFVLDGHWSWQILGFLGGILMVVCGLIEFLTHVLGLFQGDFSQTFLSVLDLYVIAIGALFAMLEYKDKLIPKAVADELKVDFLFLYKPYGRAALFTFIGFLLFSQGFGEAGGLELPYIACGGYNAVVGVLIFKFSMDAEKDLVEAKKKIRDGKMDKSKLRTFFNVADANKNGNLDTKELASLMKAIGEEMDLNELETALLELDSNHDGSVSWEEFYNWYSSD